jgi:hypothetical protein
MGQTACWLSSQLDAITIRHFCASRPGMSGAPILVLEADHIVKALAMVSRERSPTTDPILGKDDARANLAVIVRSALMQSPYLPKILMDQESGEFHPCRAKASAR